MQSPLSYWDEFAHVRLLLGRLLLAMVAFTAVRLGFIWYNAASFSPLDSATILNSVVHGWRFDVSALAYVNALFVVLSMLPIQSRSKLWYQRMLYFVFISCNGVTLGFELMDVMYFPFAFRRTGFGDFGMAGDFFMMLPELLVQFWPLIVSFILLLGILSWVYLKFLWLDEHDKQNRTWLQISIFALGLAALPILMRGGLQLRPLMPIAAAEVVASPKLMPTVSNTTLTLIHSVQQTSLEIPTWFSDEKLDQAFVPTIDVQAADSSLLVQNVVIIVLESFGDIQISRNVDGVELTPFLDSLLEESIQWEFSRSNGLRSTEGIVSIATGIPRLMEQPFLFSRYQTNQFESLATHLNPLGYETLFFHGGNAGTMGFDQFAKAAEFDHYLDRDDFEKSSIEPETYDGQWGIFDEPFFRYAADYLNNCDTNFAALLFSLTSHYPYTVPTQYERRYPNLKKHARSIRYTDDALRVFFNQLKKSEKFENTVFVLVADHVGESSDASPLSLEGYSIPLAFYFPNKDVDIIHQAIVQQIDILPSVLSVLGIEKEIFGFGQNVFQKNNKQPHIVTYESGLFQVLDSTHLTVFYGNSYKPLMRFKYQDDKELENNLIPSQTDSVHSHRRELQARVQAHHRAMVKAALTAQRYKNLNE